MTDMPLPTSVPGLNVFLNEEHVGTVHDTTPLSFTYAATWLAKRDAIAIATLPLISQPQTTRAVQAFFENLLPEGELRDYLVSQRHASSLFSLLRTTAGDTAGAFVLLPADARPAEPSYTPTTWEELARTLKKTSGAAIDINGEDTRISLAGAQDKASIAIFSDGIVRLPQNTAPSTHILKPSIRRLHKVWDSAVNETIIMLTAANCGLPTAEVFYEPTTNACVVKRFDRVEHEPGKLDRLIQYDLCQLAGVLSDRKYESEGGPGIEQCASLIADYSDQPAADLRHFAQWILFNLYVGNNDSHAKNLSIYHTPDRGLILTPFYDLMCTRIYPGLARKFALAIGGETQPGKISQEHITMMAGQLGMQPKFLIRMAADLAVRIPSAVQDALGALHPTLAPKSKVLAERLGQFVVSTTNKIAARIAS